MRTIRFTADLITPDESDTDCYGEPCEGGAGYGLEMGWWAPKWTIFEVSDDVEYADTFAYEDDPDQSPAEWLADVLAEYMPGFDGFGEAPRFYSADSIQNYVTGQDLRPCAHADGFTTEELNAAIEILSRKG